MNIGEIRDTFRRAAWLRSQLTRCTAEEFRDPLVGKALNAMVDTLRSLDISMRFEMDTLRRDEEIFHCMKMIGAWTAAQTALMPVLPPEDSFVAFFDDQLRRINEAVRRQPQLRLIKGGKT